MNYIKDLIEFAARIIAVIFVFAPHEFAHAFIAYKNGDPTAKMRGRMTLNPFRHIDPIGFVTCALVGFGWAKPVPVDYYNFRNYRKGVFTTAIAGVVVNYIIAFLAFLLYVLASRFLMPFAYGSEAAYYAVYFVEMTFFMIFSLSLCSFVFNLLPLYPLDGFRVVEAFTRQINPVQKFLRNYGQMILTILIAESFICSFAARYVPEFAYADILGYIMTFATEYIGFPIRAAWSWILTV